MGGYNARRIAFFDIFPNWAKIYLSQTSPLKGVDVGVGEGVSVGVGVGVGEGFSEGGA